MSTSPRQAARCSGKQPLLSATFVDASNCSSFSTTSLWGRRTRVNRSIGGADHKMEERRRNRCNAKCLYTKLNAGLFFFLDKVLFMLVMDTIAQLTDL